MENSGSDAQKMRWVTDPNRSEMQRGMIESALVGSLFRLHFAFGEWTVEVAARDYLSVCQRLCDHPDLKLNCLIDLCGVDYSEHFNAPQTFSEDMHNSALAVVIHLLSVEKNLRVRVRAYAQEATVPRLPSVVSIWAAANWFEREAFDLLGIVFDDHPDLRRILTDYGFIGHPLRKSFPVSGHVEMHYDSEQQRVVYRPVSIEPRQITPRIIREAQYAKT